MILIPSLFTLANLLAGILAIYLSKDNLVFTSFVCLWVAAICDGLDGALARLLNQESLFGKIFDSISDFVSFGIAPVFLWFKYQNNFYLLTLMAAVSYIFCAFFRLLRFHLKKSSGENNKNPHFEGLPITAAALFFSIGMALAWINNERYTTLLFCVILCLSLLMVSRVPFRRPLQNCD